MKCAVCARARVCECACVLVCVPVCVCVCERACPCVSVRARACVCVCVKRAGEIRTTNQNSCHPSDIFFSPPTPTTHLHLANHPTSPLVPTPKSTSLLPHFPSSVVWGTAWLSPVPVTKRTQRLLLLLLLFFGSSCCPRHSCCLLHHWRPIEPVNFRESIETR